MGEFLPACAASEVPEGSVTAAEVGGEPVAIVHTEGEFFAIRDVCSHADVPLSDGDVEGYTVECWLHGSSFDLRSGKPTGLPAVRPVPVYPVRVTDGAVLVDVEPHDAPTIFQESSQ